MNKIKKFREFLEMEFLNLRKIISLIFISIFALSSSAWATEFIEITEAEQYAILAENDDEIESEDIIVYKTGDGEDSNGSEYYDWYGRNAAILTSGDNAVITIHSADISTDATYATAVFAYGGGITITSASITTLQKNSGGIMVTNGGIIAAEDIDVLTEGDSSAAIRSDRGGGSITATRGIFETSGKGSPAIYSTASITVSEAELYSENSQGVVIEGGNSVSLDNTVMNATHSTLNGQDKTHQAVLIYQSGSGDAKEGKAAFKMTGGSITNENGDIFCVTNTSCDITLSGVTIKNNDSAGNFLRAEGQNWGKSGSNGGNVTFTASSQTFTGNVLVSSDSYLKMTLKNSSRFSGAFNPDITDEDENVDLEASLAAAGGTIDLTLEKGSKLSLTGNSYITSLTAADSNDISYGSYSLTVANDGKVYSSSNPYGKTESSSGEDDGGGGNVVIISDDVTSSDKKIIIGPSGAGCNAGFAGIILLACFAVIKIIRK